MRKVLAVALLDCRRFGFVLVSVALVAGLLPSLVSGLGERVPLTNAFFLVFTIVGLALGGSFGNDFADGKGSFFFARPLPTWALLAGKVAALLAISLSAFVACMASLWLSSNDSSLWSFDILTWRHAEALGISWTLSLFTGLAVAVRRKQSRHKGSARDLIKIPLRLTLIIGAVILIFGLFADLMVRAYLTPAPLRLLLGSSVVACLIASCVAIAAGRAESLRIARFIDRITYASAALQAAVVVAAWTYLLHPGPQAIVHVLNARGAPDGRSAYVTTTVDRGDPKRFKPVFLLDTASGQARHLNADPDEGPWTSTDGQTMAWSEATPFFFRPIWQSLGASGSYRVRTSSGDVKPLPMPKGFSDRFRVGAFNPDGVRDILPSPYGDVFAIQWGRHLTFTSSSRGEMSDLEFKNDQSIVSAAFLSTGMLRAATVRRADSAFLLELVDIDPDTGRSRPLMSKMSKAVGNGVMVQFDGKVARALLSMQTGPGRMSISLVELNDGAEGARETQLIPDCFGPAAVFLADGRIAAMAGGRDHGPLKIFSASGGPLVELPVEEGIANLVVGEMFPGVLAVQFFRSNGLDHLLIDSTNGGVVRRLSPSYFPVRYGSATPPPPGSTAARLLQSTDGKLYELPSLTAEPRLLFPLPKR